jgi:beta-lactamase class A
VFALVFAVMASYVLVVSVSAVRTNDAVAAAAGQSAANSPHHSAVVGKHPGAARSGHGGTVRTGASGSGVAAGGTGLDARFAAALRPIARTDRGNLAVGIFDESTGEQASYHGGMRFHSASVENADMLAALLLQYQRSGLSLSSYAATLSADMMKYSDNDAANGIWDLEGGQAGLQAANKALGLRHTRLNAAGYWGLTSTTISDQLRLLADLTQARSPLHAAARRYALGLMSDAVSGQRWGACAAAPGASGHGAGCAVRDGWVPDPVHWVINSIGVVRVHGQQLLIAVLSKGNRTERAGLRLVRQAAAAAARVITDTAS